MVRPAVLFCLYNNKKTEEVFEWRRLRSDGDEAEEVF